jgi:hypothetical protein
MNSALDQLNGWFKANRLRLNVTNMHKYLIHGLNILPMDLVFNLLGMQFNLLGMHQSISKQRLARAFSTFHVKV